MARHRHGIYRISQARTKDLNLSLNGAPGPMEGGLRGGSHKGDCSGPLRPISGVMALTISPSS